MTEKSFRFADDLGPEKVIEVYNPATSLKAIVVVDNVACGPAIGGVRMAPDVSSAECFRLARAMTLKNAAAGLPHGGGKSVIFSDPHMSLAEKERQVRAFAGAIKDLTDYIPGPDMGTDEACMAWIQDEIGRSVGLPPEIGGIPLDEIGATGFGLSVCAEAAAAFCGLDLKGARMVIQGFGSVGRHAAKFLAEKGAVLVAVADSRGTLANPQGLDIEALIERKAAGSSVVEFSDGESLDRDAVVGIECDIWIPAARPDVIHEGNADQVRTGMIVQGANIPVTREAEVLLHDRGILAVPDFIANAGGVICAAVEYAGGTQSGAFAVIEEKVRTNTHLCLQDARSRSRLPRDSAVDLAEARVRRAMAYRRWSGPGPRQGAGTAEP